jgi:GxxExxY protein
MHLDLGSLKRFTKIHLRTRFVRAVAQQRGIVVRYDGIIVGDYAVDLLVEESVIVELKATKAVADIHHAQCINYLRGTGLHLCLLLNFGNPRVAIQRIVLGL